jgi:hypothetical protein
MGALQALLPCRLHTSTLTLERRQKTLLQHADGTRHVDLAPQCSGHVRVAEERGALLVLAKNRSVVRHWQERDRGERRRPCIGGVAAAHGHWNIALGGGGAVTA